MNSDDSDESDRKRREGGYKRCEYCGSYKLGGHMCLFCFEYIKNAVNRLTKF